MEATEVRLLAELEEEHWWYRERRRLLADMIRISGITPGGVAVDIGAAGGGNTLVLDRMGFLAVPVEFGMAGSEVARDRGLPVVQADARCQPFADASVDCVVAFDILEHIPEDMIAAAECRRVLRPGGVMLIAVPADMRLWSAHDEAVGHVRRYGRQDLVDLVEAAGLTVLEVRSWNVILRPVIAGLRRRSTGSDLKRLNPVVNRALAALISIERRLPWLHRRRGVSLLLVARRAHQA